MFPFRSILAAIPGGTPQPGFLQYCGLIQAFTPEVRIEFIQVWPDGASPDPANPLPADSRCQLLQGPALDSLLEFATAHRADLILISEAKAGSRRTMARRLAMKAPCAVWMVPGTATAHLERVLAATDFSSPSLLALETALALSPGSCTVLHVSQQRPSQRLAQLAETAGVRSIRWEPGEDIAGTIHEVAKAEASDLIVMGDRGAGDAGAVLLGGESERMLLSSQIPVLIVKDRPRGLSILNALLEDQGKPLQPVSSSS
jgi:nucleotide-binding universal stress UspA family protein